MGLRKRIDLETHRGRERAKDIIAKMPNLNRHAIYGTAPPGSSGGGVTPRWHYDYDPGCGDCLPECPDKSLTGCAWPHGEVYWPASVVSDTGNLEVLRYTLRYILPNHQGLGFPIPESQLQGYDEEVVFKRYLAQNTITADDGNIYAYPSVDPAQYKFAHGISLGGHWKAPGDDRLAPWRSLDTSPWMPFEAALVQVANALNPSPYIGTDSPTWVTDGRPHPPGTRVGTHLFQDQGGITTNFVGTPEGDGAHLTLYSPTFDDIAFDIDPVSDPGGGSLSGMSLYLTITVFSMSGGIAVEPTMSLFLGTVRGCMPPPGTKVSDQTAWVRDVDGNYRPPTPAMGAPLAVYYDGLLAIPAIHYSWLDGKLVPTTALMQGTKVAASYVADGNDEWP